MLEKDLDRSDMVRPYLPTKVNTVPSPTNSRRNFLSNTTRAVAALPIIAGPLILKADDKSGTKDPIVG